MTEWMDRIRACGVLPVVELPDATDPVALVDALADGGIGAVEITLRTAAALDGIRAIRAARPGILVAAGTVLTTDGAAASVAAGAQLLVSPGLSPATVAWAASHDVPMLPGVATATEIQAGLEQGLTTFKFFPAESSGGAPALAALGGPFADVRFVPTGGISPDNLERYLALPNVLACGGSWLVSRALLAAGDLDGVRRRATEAAAIARRARASGSR